MISSDFGQLYKGDQETCKRSGSGLEARRRRWTLVTRTDKST
jgi:hypothetical protein